MPPTRSKKNARLLRRVVQRFFGHAVPQRRLPGLDCGILEERVLLSATPMPVPADADGWDLVVEDSSTNSQNSAMSDLFAPASDVPSSERSTLHEFDASIATLESLLTQLQDQYGSPPHPGSALLDSSQADLDQPLWLLEETLLGQPRTPMAPDGISLGSVLLLLPNVFTVDTALDVADGDTDSVLEFLATNPDGKLSLREAILLANNTSDIASPDEIRFDIPGAGPHTIVITGSGLPAITDTVIIDGYTQTGASENTQSSGTNAVLMIALDGSGLGNSDSGLTVDNADQTVIRGLAIHGFNGNGIEIDDSDDVEISGNFIGTNLSGNADAGNGQAGVYMTSGSRDVQIGSNQIADRNLISGNDSHGVMIVDSENVSVLGNLIGTTADGVSALGNTGDGVHIEGNSRDNLVGSPSGASANVIAFNQGAGVSVTNSNSTGNAIRANSIHSNVGIGIDLDGGTGVTSNDGNDGDSGPNDLLNFPVITNALVTSNTLVIDVEIFGSSNQTLQVDAYTTHGDGQGKTFVGSKSVVNGGTNYNVHRLTFSASLTAGTTLVVTATDSAGNTSEFSSESPAAQFLPSFLFTSEGNVSSSGVPGLSSWQEDSVLQFGGTSMTLGEGTTSGDLLRLFDLDQFGSSTDINGMHYVTSTVTVGSGGGATQFTLIEGDLLISLNNGGEPYTYTGNTTSVSVDEKDIFVFRPDSLGDYSSGEFYMLLDDPLNSETRAVSLVETTSIQVGDAPPLVQGTFLFAQDTPGTEDQVITYLPTTVGQGTTTGVSQVLLEGSSSVESNNGGTLDFSADIQGIHIFGWDTTISGISFLAGDILLTLDDDDVGGSNGVGTNGADVRQHDLFRLRMTETRLGPNNRSIGDALLVFDGSNINWMPSDADEDPDGFTIVMQRPANLAPTASDTNQSLSYTEDGGPVDLQDIVVSDPDAGDILTVQLIIDDITTGALTASSGNGESYNALTGVWSVSGTMDQVNAALGAVQFTPVQHNDRAAEVTVQIEDASGASLAPGLITLSVTPVNDSPALDLDFDDSSSATGADFATTFTEGSGAVLVADSVDAILSDVDNSQLTSLTVTIANRLNGTAETLAAITSGTNITANYSAGVLTLTGTDTVARYQQVLRTITYDNSANNPNTTARVITFVASDGSNTSNTATATVTITSVNDAPVIDLDANNDSGATGANFATSFTEGGGAVLVADAVDAALSDVDNAQLTSLTVTITNRLNGAAETLAAITSGTNITANYSAGVLTLTGADTVARYQQVLRTIAYDNSANNPNTTARLITFVASDGSNTSNTATATVSITSVNDAPAIDLDANNDSGATGANFATSFTEGGGAVLVADAVDAALSDVDNAQLTTLTVAITNRLNGAAETLAAITSGTNITANYSAGVLTLTGADTVARYQQVLRTITYDNSANNPNTTARLITFVASDGSNTSNTATATVTITSVNDAPVIDLDANNDSGATGADFSTSFTEGGGAVPVADAVDAVLSDVDNAQLTSLTVTITNRLNGTAETLAAITSGTNITANYSAGVLTLTGTDTVARYQQVLRTITYDNSANNPNTTARVITFVASDGSNTSNTATANVSITSVNDAPVIDLDANNNSGATGANFTTSFTEDGGAVLVADAVDAVLSDVDNAQLTSLTVTITNRLNGTAETLAAITSGTNITASYSAGVLTLTGSDTRAHYQQVLRTITYDNSANNPNTTPRLITFVASDGSNTSNTATATVSITSVNDAPVIDLDANNNSGATGANFATSFTEGGGAVLVADAVDAVLSDVDSAQIASLTVTITNRLNGAAETLAAVTSGTNITASYSAGVLTLTGADTLANYQQVLRTITYDNSANNPNTTPRLITFVASDGSNTSNTATATVSITSMNNAPIIDLDANDNSGATGANFAASFTEGGGAVLVADAVDAVLSDIDNTQLISLTVTITNRSNGAAETLAAVTSGTNITASYSAGVLTLSGNDTLARYQQVLRTITYDNTSNNPNVTPRLITFVASDGSNTSNTATATVSITSMNDAPLIDLDADNNSGATGADFSASFTEGGGAVLVADAVDAVTSDVDNAQLTSLTVTITNRLDGAAETLTAITTGTNITASYSAGVLTLSGNDTLARYQQVLRTITYDNTSNNPNVTPRLITFVASDGSNTSNTATATVSITSVNDAPLIDLDADNNSGATGADFSTSFTEGGGAVLVADAVDAVISDGDNAQLTSLTVTITNRLDGAAEMLTAITTGTNITASYSAGVLTLSGNDTLARYQQVLRSITYDNTSNNPNVTPRLITFVASDGSSTSNTATATVAITGANDAPLVDLDANNNSGATGADFMTTFTEGDGPVLVADAADAIVIDRDNTHLTLVTVRLTNPHDGSHEVLRATTAGTNISASYAGGVLRLAGSDTVANYQQVLRTVTYQNTSEAPTEARRVLNVVAHDGLNVSSVARAFVDVSGVNDLPTLTVPAAQFTTEDVPISIQGLSVADIDALNNVLRVTLHVDNGLLRLDTNLLGGVAEEDVQGNGTGTVAIQATISEINTTLRSATGLVFVGDANYTGSDTLRVLVNDAPSSTTAIAIRASVGITIAQVNDVPLTRMDHFTMIGGESLTVAPAQVLANDFDFDGDSLTVQFITAQFGTIVQNPDGSIVYTAPSGFAGLDTIRYIADDGTDSSSITDVVITVLPGLAPTTPTNEGGPRPTDDPQPPPVEPEPPTELAPPAHPKTQQHASELPVAASKDPRQDEMPLTLHPIIDQFDTSWKPIEDPPVTVAIVRSVVTSEIDMPAAPKFNRERTDSPARDAYLMPDWVVASSASHLWTQLDAMREDLASAPNVAIVPVVGTASATTAFTVGYVMWLLKGGQLLTSLIAQMPAWQMVDPLPVLNSLAKVDEDEDEAEDDDSLQSLLHARDGEQLQRDDQLGEVVSEPTRTRAPELST